MSFVDPNYVTSPPIDTDALKNEIKLELLSVIFPIHSFYISQDESFNPNGIFPGVWVKISENITLRQCGESHAIGTIFGEATHTLTVNEMPSHTHTLNVGWAAGNLGSGAGRTDLNNPKNRWNMAAAGGSQPHNNIGPSLAVNIWHRVE